MAPKARVQKRLYYKIGEACKALGIQPYVLRYWETEFPALSPSKSRSGQRVYSEKELEIIRRIKQLLYDEGYTIAGAKKKLEGELAAGILGEPAGAPGPAAGGSPAGPLIFQGAAAAGAASASPAVQPVSGSAPAGAGSGAGTAPVRTVPLPLVPAAPAAPIPGVAAAAATGAAGPSGREDRPRLPLDPPPPLPAGSPRQASTAAAEASAAPRNAASAKVPAAAIAGPAAGHAASPAAAPEPPSAATTEPPAASSQALDTDAAKQIETLRKGIHKALQEAREILALLDSRSPQ